MDTQLERIKDRVNELFKKEALQKEKPVVGRRYFIDNTGAATGIYVGLDDKYKQAFKDVNYSNKEYGYGIYSLNELGWVTFAISRHYKPVENED